MSEFIRELRQQLDNGQVSLSQVAHTGQIADVIEGYLLILAKRHKWKIVNSILSRTHPEYKAELFIDLQMSPRDSTIWEGYRDVIESLEVELSLY